MEGQLTESVNVIKKNEDKIRYWISEKDTGIYNAMNKGILVATGEYCLFLNSGDFLYNKNIISSVFSDAGNEDIISGAVLTYSNLSDKRVLLEGINDTNITLGSFLYSGLRHQATFIKRELFNKFGLYDESYRISSDYIFFLKVLIWENATYKYINRIITNYNFDGLSSIEFHNKEVSEFDTKLATLLPPRILSDYKQHYFEIIQNFQSFFISRIIFKGIYRLIKSYKYSNRHQKNVLRKYQNNHDNKN